MLAIVVALVAVAALVGPSLPVRAATDRFVNFVTGTDGTNTCTNPGAPCKTIVRAHTVAVAGDTIRVAAVTQLEKPVITKAIVLEGAGPSTVIQPPAGSPGIVLTVNSSLVTNVVTINKLTIRNGVGGLFVQTGRALVNDVTVTNNTGTFFGAGVIVAAPTQAVLTNTVVSANIANIGGGIFNAGNLSIVGGSVINNVANATNAAGTGLGGGIYNHFTPSPAQAAVLSLSGVTVSGNRAVATGTAIPAGGGIYNIGTATIGDGTVSGNAAAPLGAVRADGGGIYNTGTASFAGTTTITNSVITGNTASNGAGAMNLSFGAAGSRIAVTGGRIENNAAQAIATNVNTGLGGGTYSLAVGTPALSLKGVTVSGNRALAAGSVAGNGGGVYSATVAEIAESSTLSANTATNGGGVYNGQTGSLTVSSSTVNGNSATSAGGGIYNHSTSGPTLLGTVAASSSSITSNTAANGGGVFNFARFSATDGEISDNTVTPIVGNTNTGFGGGIYSLSGATPFGLVLAGTEVERNRAVTNGTIAGNGGGLLNFSFASINSPSFADNTATGSGGAVYNFVGTVALTNTPFTGNFAPLLGGTIYDAAASAEGAPTMTLVDSPITGTGDLSFLGGGVAVGPNAKFQMTGASISGARAVSGGGMFVQQSNAASAGPPAVAATPGGQAILDHADVTGNIADGGFGGGILNGGRTTVTDAEISGNTARPNANGDNGSGGGVYNSAPAAAPDPARLSLGRVTLAGNTANGGSAVVSAGPASIRTSTITENTATPGFGAIVSSAALSLVHDTINRNSSPSGFGGVVQFGTVPVDVAGTVIADNGTPGNCAGPIADRGHNATNTTTGTGACSFTNNAVVGDPRLGPLADNGGPTRTELPMNNSPVLNKIPPATPAGFNDAVSAGAVTLCPGGGTDQRGVSLPQGSRCDIGSVELSGITPPELTGPDHALFVIGTPNSVGFTATGVPTPVLSTSGDALPSGVTFTDNGDGTATLGGTAAPGTAGTYHFTITASNGEAPDATIAFTLVVIDPLVITTTSLPEGTPGQPYSTTLAATGGTTPYTWTLDAGQLPPGLTLDPDGTIHGTPTTRGIYNFTVRVTDSTDPQQTTTKELFIPIRADTAIEAEPAFVKVALPSLRVAIVRLEARLTELPGNAPLAGQTIVFKAGAQQLCTAVTNSNGVARCSNVSVGTTLQVLLALGYDAIFEGTPTLRPSADHGPFVQVVL